MVALFGFLPRFPAIETWVRDPCRTGMTARMIRSPEVAHEGIAASADST